MRKVAWQAPLGLVLFLILVFNLPVTVQSQLREKSISFLSIPFSLFRSLKEKISFSDSSLHELESLRRDNLFLTSQLEVFREWLLSEDRIEEQLIRVRDLASTETEEEWKSFLQRRRTQLLELLRPTMKALPARVVYREPVSWSSFLFVDVGAKNNQSLGFCVVQKNSPVVLGNKLVGIVEEVGWSRSKVRLLTDSSLVVSVRAIRGSTQHRLLAEYSEAIRLLLEERENPFASEQERNSFLSSLQRLCCKSRGHEEFYLAKGELFGCSHPLWRTRGSRLKGVGFNYASSDEEGKAKDLRFSHPPLLKVGDLLITTGLDGLFPPGLDVALVSSITPLAEGSYAYSLEAEALMGMQEDLQTVFILPPLP